MERNLHLDVEARTEGVMTQGLWCLLRQRVHVSRRKGMSMDGGRGKEWGKGGTETDSRHPRTNVHVSLSLLLVSVSATGSSGSVGVVVV